MIDCWLLQFHRDSLLDEGERHTLTEGDHVQIDEVMHAGREGDVRRPVGEGEVRQGEALRQRWTSLQPI